VGPQPSPDSPLAGVAADVLVAASEGWVNLQPSIALEATWRLIREANAHLEANEPWKAEPGPKVDAVLGDALEVLRIVSLLATPAMPTTSAAVWSRIGLPGAPTDHTLPAAAAWGGYPGGLPVGKGAPLFPRMRD
jgi:methionyl-tRNA synthetase